MSEFASTSKQASPLSSSRHPGFFRLSLKERRQRLRELCGLDDAAISVLDRGGIDVAAADRMIENVIGRFALPLGVATNFRVNDRDVLLPMAIEEPSVIAAASNAAKWARAGGGFVADVTDPVMIGQVQLGDVPNCDDAVSAITSAEPKLLELARALCPTLVKRGGGPRSIEARVLGDGATVVVHVLVDVRDAMGANTVNTIAEGIADELARLSGARRGLRILSNLSTHRMVKVTASVPHDALDDTDGAGVAELIVDASKFAELDPYRAATHNKGIMNGVDAVLVATANDWRGVEAGAHAYAAQSGRYAPLAIWRNDDGVLKGTLEMPLAAGTVGGAISTHPAAQVALEILKPSSANELAGIIGAAGLASNLAALRALATDGIQSGHMPLHARKLRSS